MAWLKFFFVFFIVQSCFAKFLSLTQAIDIALKKNPNLINARIDRTAQKYSIKVSEQEFKPNYFFEAFANTMEEKNRRIVERSRIFQMIQDSATLHPYVNYKNTYGTEVKMSSTFNSRHDFLPQLHITQNFIRGFDPKINSTTLDNTIDQNQIDIIALNLETATIISDTIKAYLDIVSSDQEINAALRSLKISRDEVKRSMILFSKGLDSKKSLDINKIALRQAQSNLSESRSIRKIKVNTLKDLLNITSSAPLVLEDPTQFLMRFYPIPSKESAQRYVLKNNMEYQQLLIQKRQNERLLAKAKDDQKWDLNLETITDLADPQHHSAVSLNLSVPIRDFPRKQLLVNAKVTLRKSQQNIIAKEKQLINEVSDTIDSLKLDLDTMHNQYVEIIRRDELIRLFEKRLQNDQISLFEFNREIFERENDADAYTSTMMKYLGKLIVLNLKMGLTLDQWHVKS